MPTAVAHAGSCSLRAPAGKGSWSTRRRRHLRENARRRSQIKELDDIVVNDAGVHLSPAHREALLRGLSFIPTRNTSKHATERRREDLERLRRNINLRIHFGTRQSSKASRSHISSIIPSKWMPPDYVHFNAVWQECSEELSRPPPVPAQRNISREAQRAWRELSSNRSCYTLKADKGGKTVIWGREEYRKEGLRQLGDAKTYRELSQEEAEAAYVSLRDRKTAVTNTLHKGGFITATEQTNLQEESFKMPSIYFLPKIHKEKREDTGTFAGRPIIAAVGGILKSLDEFLAHLTAPLLHLIPGSLIDTRALINDLERFKDLPKNTILFSADVEALYPSIPWDEGISSATKFYATNFHILLRDAKKNGRLPPPNPKLFKAILELVLKENYLTFQNSKWFHQQSGTAMGCSISVFFANTYMYYRTRKLLDNPPKNLLYLGRYIDDLIGIWIGPKEEITSSLFSDVIDANLRLTYVIGGDSVEALDLLITVGPEGKLILSLYRKPAEGHQFVHFSSAHPVALKRSLPYSQLLRIRRNCTRPSDYQREAAALLERFRKRGYPEDVLKATLNKAATVTRESLLKPKKATRRKEADRLTFVTDHPDDGSERTRTAITSLYERLLQAPEVAERLPYMQPPLPSMPPRIAFRSGRKLGDGLGSAYKKGLAETG